MFFVNPLFGKPAEFFGYTIDPAKLGIADFVKSIPSWKFKYGLIYMPLLLYGLLSLGQRFPATERVQANVSTATMFLQILRPMFLIWAFCMLLTASTELGTNAWMESILTRTAHVSGTLVFIYITLLMFILRFFAGPIAHKFSPVGMLFFCSILTAGGLYWLSYRQQRRHGLRRGDRVRPGHRLLLADNARRDGGTIPQGRRTAAGADGLRRQPRDLAGDAAYGGRVRFVHRRQLAVRM